MDQQDLKSALFTPIEHSSLIFSTILAQQLKYSHVLKNMGGKT